MNVLENWFIYTIYFIHQNSLIELFNQIYKL